VPLAFVQIEESSVASLVPKEQHELTPGASAALAALMRQASAIATPPRRPHAWLGELPAVVSESAKQAEHAFREHLAETEAAAAAAAAAQDGAGGLVNGHLGEDDANLELFDTEDLPEDCYPLVVCKVPFTPQRSSAEAMLQLQAGDLVRVASQLDTCMYYGFRQGDARHRGWFPRRSVKLLEDPLSEEADNLPVQLGIPVMPQVPEEVLRLTR
jgi:hypothetical protein